MESSEGAGKQQALVPSPNIDLRDRFQTENPAEEQTHRRITLMGTNLFALVVAFCCGFFVAVVVWPQGGSQVWVPQPFRSIIRVAGAFQTLLWDEAGATMWIERYTGIPLFSGSIGLASQALIVLPAVMGCVAMVPPRGVMQTMLRSADRGRDSSPRGRALWFSPPRARMDYADVRTDGSQHPARRILFP